MARPSPHRVIPASAPLHAYRPPLATLFLAATLLACSPASSGDDPPADGAADLALPLVPPAPVFADAAGSTVTPLAAEPLDFGEAPPGELERVCAALETLARGTLAADVQRQNGDFIDFFTRSPRTGCRMHGAGNYTLLAAGADPLKSTVALFDAHGWQADQDYSADGPEGTVFGMRRGELLCLVSLHWDAGDDDHDAPDAEDLPDAPSYDDQWFTFVYECAPVPIRRTIR